MSRWIELYCTSPSGKTLFVCRMCGVISPAPNKECSELPDAGPHKVTFSCAMLEEIEAALISVGEGPTPVNAVLQVIYSDKTGSPDLVQWLTMETRTRRSAHFVEQEMEKSDGKDDH